MKHFFGLAVGILLFAFNLPLARAEIKSAAAPRERILILISIDGLRWDYPDKFKEQTPILNKLAAEGVRAKKLIPVFPTMTFPNHQTIATGLRPKKHGIPHNTIFDPKTKKNFVFNKYDPSESFWWGGEPIWATAVKQGRRANCMFWPGVNVEMAGVLPTEFKAYDKDATPLQCVEPVLSWLDAPKERRADLLVTYFHHVDFIAHREGADSPALTAPIKEVDDAVGRLIGGIHQRKLDQIVNLVIISDHGMANISTNRVIELRDFVDLKTVQVDFSGASAGLRPLDGNVDALYKKFAGKERRFKVYRRENMPKRYHFMDNKRIPPVVLVADDGWYLSKRPANEPFPFVMNKATHGFDPELDSMGATFIAWGRAFRRGVTLKPFENVHVYHLLCATLGVKPAKNDGDERLLKEVLAK